MVGKNWKGYDADDFTWVSTWLPSICFQSAEPHLMVLEQHCAAKVNLIAAEGPLEEDRMVALHGFSKFRIWNQLDVSMCDWYEWIASCETCLIMFFGYLFGILVGAFKFPRLKLTRCTSNKVFQFSSKCDFATMASIFPSIVISILWTAGSLGGKVGVPMMVVYSPFNRCETLMRLTLDMVDVGLLCWGCRHM